KQPPGQGAPYVSEGNVKIHNRQDGNNQKLWRVTMEYSKEDLMEAKKQCARHKTDKLLRQVARNSFENVAINSQFLATFRIIGGRLAPFITTSKRPAPCDDRHKLPVFVAIT
ncbi:hypothetical protein, partial [Adlercreutzia sp.]|uniref:hypothetical protein n=1 Tax=Adlercreutzia sp. TaxID=1872387 RepID=UPI003AB8F93E